MQSKSRAFSVAAATVLPLLLVAACGGSSDAGGSSNNLTPITGSSYVTIEPATTTTTTTLPAVDPDSLEPGSTSPVEQTYTVVSGDSVSKIAALHGISADLLAAYNSWPEGIQHAIFPGDTVRIPPDSQVPGAAASTDTASSGDTTADSDSADDTASSSGECPTTYVITADDTSRIKVAEKFDITYEQMDAANVNTPGYSGFVVGTPITIPCP